MKRALAARAKHDPNGLAPPVGGPMAGHVVTSSPTQPPLKIQKFEVKHDEAPSSSEVPQPSPRPVEPMVISSSEPAPDSTPPEQHSAEKNSTHVISGSSSLPSSPVPSHSTQGAAYPSKTKHSMKRQRPSPATADFDCDDDDDGADKSAFFLKHQNAALASELQQLRYQLKLLEKERDFRRNQCHDACQLLHSLEATWNAMEVALQLGQQPQDEREEELERTTTVADDTPRSTGTGESVELIGALLDSLARLGKESLPVDGSDDEIQLIDIHQTADSVSKRATALQRWIWGLLRKITSEDDSGKHPLLKLAKLEAKLSALKAQVQNFQIQITELAKCRDDAVESERRVRRGLYRLNAGRMKLEEVLKAIETDGRDGSDALMAMEENVLVPAAESHAEEDDDVVDSSQIAQLRKQIRDLEEISSSREKQIAELTAQREENQKRINVLALPSDTDKASNEKELPDEDIKGSTLYTDAWTRMTTAERLLREREAKLAQVKEGWAAARGDAEYATKSLEEHLMKHKKRWAELTETDENEDGVVEDVVVRSEIVVQAELIAELEHKLKQALENVRRADVVRASLEEISQLNTALQARVDDLKAKNALLISSSKVPATRPDTPSAKEPVDTEKGSVKAEIQNADRLQKEHRRMRKDLAAAIQSKENAKARLEKSEKERETLIRTNSRLAKQSAEKDEMNAKSLSTILHLKSVTEKLTQENELFEQQIKSAGQVNLAARLAANAKERVTDEAFSIQRELEEKIALLERECETVKAEYEIAVGSLEKKKAEMSDLERDAATAKERCDELVAEITKQEADKRKILENLAIAQREAGDAAKAIARLRNKSGGDGNDSVFTPEQLSTQITVLKSRLACPVCNHRDKSCIVLRCRHMFCKHCMDENIKNRNRKCPSCGQRFDTKDVEDIWL